MKVVQSFDLILTAAGSSTRFNNKNGIHTKKECVLIDGKSILSLSLEPFLLIPGLKRVVVTYPEGHEDDIRKALSPLTIPSGIKIYFVRGGESRTESVRNGVMKLKKENTTSSLIAVHDGARPYVKRELIEKILENAEKYGSSAPFLKLTDAVKSRDGKYVVSSLDREKLARLQTPQIFNREKFIFLYSSMSEDASYQDDVEPYVLSGEKCYLTEGDEENRKITYREDLRTNEMRIGYGNDIHRLEEGRKLVLGGVVLPHTLGEAAHSDGDVLLHAVIDAVLGGYALGDIGHFFPPEDDRWKDAESSTLLKIILEKVRPEIVNLDSVITLEGFKLAPYITEIRESLSALLGIGKSRISVKAKTNEGLDALGKGMAVKAEVVILFR